MARSLETLQKQYHSGAPAPGGMRGPGPGRGPGGPGRQRGPGGKPKNTRRTLGRLFGYIGKYKFQLLLVLLCMLCSTTASLTGSYMLRPIINRMASAYYVPTVYTADGSAVPDAVSMGAPVLSADGKTASVDVFINAQAVSGVAFSVLFDNADTALTGMTVSDRLPEEHIWKNSAFTGSYSFRTADTLPVTDWDASKPAVTLTFTLGSGADVRDIALATESNAAYILQYLIRTLLILLAVYLVGVIATWTQQRIMLHISQSAGATIRRDLFNKVQSLPVRFHDTHSTGEIMSRFTNDVDNISVMLDNSVVSLISGVITLVGTFTMMVTTNIWLTLITVCFIPLFLFGAASIAKRSSKYYGAQQAALGAVNGYIEESVTGQKVIKVFNHEADSVEEFCTLNDDMRDKQFKAQFFGGIMGPIMGNTGQISYAVTAGVGGLLCLFGGFDVGGLTIFVNYSRQFAMPVTMLSQQTSAIFSALAGAERVFGVMDMEPEKPDVPDAVVADNMRGCVELADVSFGYLPERRILKHISLTAEPGQKIAFVGSTGAGKTTVTNLLNRFYDIDEGVITIDGVDIRQMQRDCLRRNIAMVLQDTHLFTGTVMENIRYGRLDATDAEVIEAAKTAGAHSFIMRLADGYQTVIEGDGANLSQGQRQLLNIARAAVSHAPILVLDEATSSVDTRTERHIEHGLARLMRDRTTFVIAHRLSTVRNADVICVLEQGEIVERGNHEELLALRGRYYELYTGVRELD